MSARGWRWFIVGYGIVLVLDLLSAGVHLTHEAYNLWLAVFQIGVGAVGVGLLGRDSYRWLTRLHQIVVVPVTWGTKAVGHRVYDPNVDEPLSPDFLASGQTVRNHETH